MKHRFSLPHQKLMGELARVRKAAGLSQRDLSAKLKRTHSFCYYIEGGHRSLEFCEFVDWMKACGADPLASLQRILDNQKEISDHAAKAAAGTKGKRARRPRGGLS